jgi:hypothetical protein
LRASSAAIEIEDVFDRGRAIIMSTGSDGKTSWRARKPDGLHGVSDSPNVQVTKPDKQMTAAQRRGLARKITAYLRRSGLDCELVGDHRNPPRMLN